MLLTWMIFIPLIGMVLVLLLPRDQDNAARWLTFAITLLPLLIAVFLFTNYDNSEAGIQHELTIPWIESFGISYHIGLDGLSVTLVLLTALLGPICVGASWKINKGVKAYMALFLLLETGMIGFFCALDLFLFYVFFELTLLPMYFLVGIWGGERREYAAIKFFLYTLFGSVLMLVAMIAVYLKSGEAGARTFDIIELTQLAQTTGHPLADPDFQKIVFLGFFVGFAVKVPIFPFHTWLPDAHVQAPTAISVILAGILLKMGTYGLVRINVTMLPEGMAASAGWLAILAVVNIIYGSLCALFQTDFKKMVAYSSIGHMGFVILGIAALNKPGITGAILQMFNHGVISGMLFLLVGVIYDRAHHRDINGFGGLGAKMPVYTGITTLAFMASLGLPGLSGFVGEALSLLGAFDGAFDNAKFLTILSTIGIVIGAAYFLWTLQRIFLGQLNPKYEEIEEINAREIATLLPLGVLTILLGIWPHFIIDMFDQNVDAIVKAVNASSKAVGILP